MVDDYYYIPCRTCTNVARLFDEPETLLFSIINRYPFLDMLQYCNRLKLLGNRSPLLKPDFCYRTILTRYVRERRLA